MSENNQKIKLLKILEFLRAESNAGKPVSTSQIIGYLNSIHISCERRTLYKDMDMLIDSGANIIKTELGRENAYYIDEVSFSLAEVKTLIDAVQAANFVPADKTAELVDKLLSYAGIRRSEIIRDNIIFYNNHKHTNENIYGNIEQIELAIKHKRQVSFYYFDLDEKRNRIYRKNKKRYITDPVALVFSEDNYYLVAFSQKYHNAVNYRVDRMDIVEVEEEAICEEALIKKRKTETYTEQVFKMYNGETETVTIEFAPDMLGVIYDKFGESIEIRHADKGWLKIKVAVQISPTFWGWIYQLEDKIKIVSPEGIKPPFDIIKFYNGI
ncbi:WYL domain-containing protein [Ruminococcus sp.]|uniref:helix-turn-helix transcriptional regulator n=1 Tax=Ruminococcus sp. TaxID=41978 RepID=UPI0025EE505E|nr:WYL domain-containing protein [Ruminococcus sp.]